MRRSLTRLVERRRELFGHQSGDAGFTVGGLSCLLSAFCLGFGVGRPAGGRIRWSSMCASCTRVPPQLLEHISIQTISRRFLATSCIRLNLFTCYWTYQVCFLQKTTWTNDIRQIKLGALVSSKSYASPCYVAVSLRMWDLLLDVSPLHFQAVNWEKYWLWLLCGYLTFCNLTLRWK